MQSWKRGFKSARCGQDISYPQRLHSDTAWWKEKRLWNSSAEPKQLQNAQELCLTLPLQTGLEMPLLSTNTNFKA